MKRVKIIIVEPGTSGKTEILPRDDGRWMVQEFEYDDQGKRTNTSKNVMSHREVLGLVAEDGLFAKTFDAMLSSEVSL